MAANAIRRRVRADGGQTVILVGLCIAVLVGAIGIAVDVGRMYVVQRQLQTAVDAAALAAAQNLPNGAQAASAAAAYDAEHGRANEIGALSPAPPTVTLKCLSVRSAGISCATGTGCPGPVGCNAINVREQVSVVPWFMRIFGLGSHTVTATATASMAGGPQKPLDIEIVTDTTGSMESKCSSDVSGIPTTSRTPTKLDCVKDGIRALLGTLAPCSATLSSCGPDVSGTHNVSNPVDRVGLMVFPALDPSRVPLDSTSVVTAETNCTSDITSRDVTYGSGANFEAVPLSSDYRISDTAASLNSGSQLVKAVYWGKCPGGTYPENGGSGGSSLAGGASADRSVAETSDASRTIGGGPGPSGNVSTGATGGGTAIGGGPASAANRSASDTGASTETSLAVPVPAAETAGDLVLLSVTTHGLHGNDHICAPDDGTWTEVRQEHSGSSNSNRITVAVFASVRGGVDTAPYEITFKRGACSKSKTRSVRASAIAVRYTGVDPTDPVDVSDGSALRRTDDMLTAGAVTTSLPGERVVRVFGSGATAFTAGVPSGQSAASSSTLTGVVDAAQALSGTTGPSTATTEGADYGVADTVALKPLAGATSISVPVPANETTGDLLLVAVTARGLDRGSVCPPDSSWSELPSQSTQPASGGASSVTLATFVSTRTATDTQPYVFTFASGSSCSSGAASASASAVAVRYTNVDQAAPADASSSRRGASTTPTAGSVTTTTDGDRVVRAFGAGGTAFAGGTVPAGQSSSGDSTVTGITDASQASAGATGSAPVAIGARDNWVAETIALKPTRGATSLSVPRPADRADGDFLLVAVTASGLGGGRICAPSDSAYPWTEIGQDTGGAITQATFSSFRPAGGGDPGPYTFTFTSGSACSGPPALAAATALAIRYTGVDPITPIDASRGDTGTGTHPTPPSVTTSFDNDQVVRFYGTAASSISGDTETSSGASTSTGFTGAAQQNPGATGTGPNVATANRDWAADTVAVKAAQPGCSGNCHYGLEDPGGAGTYYASAIDAAQAVLTGPDARSGTQRVIILLSDGDANTGGSNPCHAGIQAAENAETPLADGSTTWVFAIAYNASATGGCNDDRSPRITALCAMHEIARNHVTDSSVSPGAPGAVCDDNSSDPAHRFFNQPADGDLTGIFQNIGQSLGSSRLVSDAAS
jgi:Flp pilus assembly protein TadG